MINAADMIDQSPVRGCMVSSMCDRVTVDLSVSSC